jgi:hypothetical protein
VPLVYHGVLAERECLSVSGGGCQEATYPRLSTSLNPLSYMDPYKTSGVHTPHSTLHTPHSTLHTPHSGRRLSTSLNPPFKILDFRKGGGTF